MAEGAFYAKGPSASYLRTSSLSRWVRGDPSTLGVSQMKRCGVTLDVLPFLCDHSTGIAPSAIESFKVVSEARRPIGASRGAAILLDWDFTHLHFRCEE
jgi:hypothetical protein